MAGRLFSAFRVATVYNGVTRELGARVQADWLTTSTLLHDLQDRDNGLAWERLVARFRAPLVGFARQIGLSQADAEDAAQETLAAFASAYQAGRYDRDKGRLSKWLFGIAYKQTLRLREQAARRGARTPIGGATSLWQQVPDEGVATQVWDAEWEAAIWRQCLEHVRPEFEATTLHAFELAVRDQLPAAEAARRLDVPVKVIYNAKHRVLKRLRELRAEIEEIL